MPSLADVLGQLTTAITRARVQADLEAIRVAELYASHPFLKHFAVPRFRLPNVDITIPAIIEQIEDSQVDSAPPDKLSTEDILDEAVTTLEAVVGRRALEVSRDELERVQASIGDRVRSMERANELSVDVGQISKHLAHDMARRLKELRQLADIPSKPLIQDLQRSLSIRLLNKRKLPPSMKVLVETSQVREAGPDDTLVRLTLRITEDALEWTMVEMDGEEDERLLPE